ncbi:hypothetical protein [Marinomonas sp. THO17]|uniref:hypothetical protein n=1 Tax=Marinomonas sp. THO17 TaxID=3149048 RepID=UPI00336C1365
MTTRLQAGWLGVPILTLLLIIAGLSAAAQTQLLSDYQWRGELQAQASPDSIWRRFMQAKVSQVQFSQAEPSLCQGFCALADTQWQGTPIQYEQGGQVITYQWHSYQSADKGIYHRLCATINRQEYYCWWWHERRLHSQAWVSSSD